LEIKEHTSEKYSFAMNRVM